MCTTTKFAVLAVGLLAFTVCAAGPPLPLELPGNHRETIRRAIDARVSPENAVIVQNYLDNLARAKKDLDPTAALLDVGADEQALKSTASLRNTFNEIKSLRALQRNRLK